MSRTLTDVLVDRERLIARCAQQRADVASSVRGLAGPIAVVDKAVAGARFLGRHPLAVAGAVAGVTILRGRSVVRLVMRAAALWRIVGRTRDVMRLFGR